MAQQRVGWRGRRQRAAAEGGGRGGRRHRAAAEGGGRGRRQRGAGEGGGRGRRQGGTAAQGGGRGGGSPARLAGGRGVLGVVARVRGDRFLSEEDGVHLLQLQVEAAELVEIRDPIHPVAVALGRVADAAAETNRADRAAAVVVVNCGQCHRRLACEAALRRPSHPLRRTRRQHAPLRSGVAVVVGIRRPLHTSPSGRVAGRVAAGVEGRVARLLLDDGGVPAARTPTPRGMRRWTRAEAGGGDGRW